MARTARPPADGPRVDQPAEATHGRPERQAVPAPRVLAVPQLPAPHLPAGPRTGPVPPRPVHVLAADVLAPQPARLRRPDPRGMHRGPPAVEHAAPGARAAQRPDLR